MSKLQPHPAGYYLVIPHRISDVLIFVYGVRFRISTISGEQIRRIVSERQSVQFQREYRHSRRRFHIEVDSLAKLDPGSLHFVVELEPHPETLLHAKEAGQPEVLFRRAAAATGLHFGKMGGKDTGGRSDILLGGRPLVEGIAQGLGEGVGQGHGFHGDSVVAGDLALVGVVVLPTKRFYTVTILVNGKKVNKATVRCRACSSSSPS